ncbi:unnamed protein product [Urochloa humidicola]
MTPLPLPYPILPPTPDQLSHISLIGGAAARYLGAAAGRARGVVAGVSAYCLGSCGIEPWPAAHEQARTATRRQHVARGLDAGSQAGPFCGPRPTARCSDRRRTGGSWRGAAANDVLRAAAGAWGTGRQQALRSMGTLVASIIVQIEWC